MDSKLVNYMFECMKEYVIDGIEEAPERFRYTRYVNILIEELDINLPNMDEVMFRKILKEFISYIR